MSTILNGKLRTLIKYSLLFSCSISSSAVLASSPWQGSYLGGYLASANGNNHLSTDVGSITDTSYFTNQSNINAVNSAGSLTKGDHENISGIEAGHDWGYKYFVFGLVMDYSGSRLSSTSTTSNQTYPDFSGQYAITTSMSINRLFTLRGRIGFNIDLGRPVLFYLTGGPAITQLKVSNNFTDNTGFSGSGSSQDYQNQIGWTTGAGIAILPFNTKFFNHLSFYVEYLNLQVPSVKTKGTIYNTQGGFGIPTQSMASPFSTAGKYDSNLLKLGVNYKFDD